MTTQVASASNPESLALTRSTFDQALNVNTTVGVYNSRFQDFITLADATISSKLLTSLQLSPNGEFALYEEADQPVTYDGYRINSKPRDVRTVVRDTTTGELILTLEGASVQLK